ncbi:MAG: hypothetical protein O3A42_20240, partial [Actinobacteria bacterium]|nr:hypothetical protein [Actinomycetota bacterium]
MSGAGGTAGLLYGSAGSVGLPLAAASVDTSIDWWKCVGNALGCVADTIIGPLVRDQIAQLLQGLYPPISPIAALIGQTGWDVIRSLIFPNPFELPFGSEAVSALQNLINTPDVLRWLSGQVGYFLALDPNAASLPPGLVATLGNAVAYFVQQSLGTSVQEVLDGLATLVWDGVSYTRVLGYALNYANNYVKYALDYVAYGAELAGWYLTFRIFPEPIAPTKPTFSTSEMMLYAIDGLLQPALARFIGIPGIQTHIGSAFAGLVNVLTGTITPAWVDWDSGIRFASAMRAAVDVLGADSPALPNLSGFLGTPGLLQAYAQISGDSVASTLLTTVSAALGVSQADLISILSAANATATGSDSRTAAADYAGTLAAVALLGKDSPDLAAVSSLIGGNVAELLGSVGGTVAQTLGGAYTGLLTTQPVGEALSIYGYNLAASLFNGAPMSVSPEVIAGLSTVFANVAGSTVVSLLGSSSPVPDGVGAFVTNTLSGLAGAPAMQTLVGQLVATTVAEQFPAPIATQVSSQLGSAVTSLLADTGFSTAVAQTIGSAAAGLLSLLGQAGAASALASVAGQAGGDLMTAVQAGQDLRPLVPQLVTSFLLDPTIQGAVSSTAATAVGSLLADSQVIPDLLTVLKGLITTVVGDSTVRQYAGEQVATQLAALLGGGDFGQIVGAKVGAAVLDLLTDPVVVSALPELVTVAQDFLSRAGVGPALATAAGDLVVALMTDPGPTAALAAVESALRNGKSVEEALAAGQAAYESNQEVMSALAVAASTLAGDAEVDAAVRVTVSGVVSTLLGDTGLWQKLDATAVSLIGGLL